MKQHLASAVLAVIAVAIALGGYKVWRRHVESERLMDVKYECRVLGAALGEYYRQTRITPVIGGSFDLDAALMGKLTTVFEGADGESVRIMSGYPKWESGAVDPTGRYYRVDVVRVPRSDGKANVGLRVYSVSGGEETTEID